jgi:HAMP domain-containing protein
METIYRELLSLRKDVEAVKLALIPEEKVPEKELAELGQTRKEMESGKEKPFRAVFGK